MRPGAGSLLLVVVAGVACSVDTKDYPLGDLTPDASASGGTATGGTGASGAAGLGGVGDGGVAGASGVGGTAATAGSSGTGGSAGAGGLGGSGAAGAAGGAGGGAAGTSGMGGAAGASGTGGSGGTSASGGTGGSGATGGAGGTGGCPTGVPGPALVDVNGAYCMDATEVTNAQYKAFLDTTPATSGQDAWCSWNTTYTPSTGWPAAGIESYPVAYVDWCDAYAYCSWAGKRLCGKIGGGANGYADFADATKSEWFNACSAGGAKTYPYGNTYDGAKCNGIDYGASAPIAVATAPGCEGGYPGLHDMSGNVMEWEDSCAGTGATDWCRLRGGGTNGGATGITCNLDQPFFRNYVASNIGFRCCSG